MTLAQIKQEIAALLNVDSVNAKSLFELANCNSVVLKAIQSIDALQFNLRTTETWQAILNKLKGEGVKEDLSSDVVEVTVATVKDDKKEDKKNNSTKGQEYKLFLPELISDIVAKLDDNNTYKVERGSGHTPVVYHLCVDNKDGQTKLLVIIGSWLALSTIEMYYRDNLISKAIKPDVTSTIVTTETSDNKFKGIPVEHYSNYDWKLKTDDLDTVTISPWLVDNEYVVTTGGQTSFQTNLSTAVEIAKNYLATGVNTVKVPSRLTPKLELFGKFTEYTFLMQCYLELIGYFYNLSSSLSEISNQLYLTWCSLTEICFKRYVLMPTIGSDNHTKLLMMWHEATYNSLESKSIYA